jgi:GH15 family glucan-1,4-alpha-glucosidase
MNRAAELYKFSKELILSSQYPEGAWHAAPGYPTYEYCWFRDSSYIAYAADRAGEHEASWRFHRWCFTVLQDKLTQWKRNASHDQFMSEKHLVHTRYTHDGRAGEGNWENHQLDGLGTWLWALAEHVETADQSLSPRDQELIRSLCDYLFTLWRFPCYDLWEEYRDTLHLYTLVSIYSGLARAQILISSSFEKELSEIRQFIDRFLVANGHFVKMTGDVRVDASALGLYKPYGFVDGTDPVFRATLKAIEKTLLTDGGLYRYRGDEFYGGGRWILLTCWLGWTYQELGLTDKSAKLLDWVLSRSDASLLLPEQVSDRLQVPQRFSYWKKRWGAPAKPLLWSHAMYMLLYQSMR